MQPYENIAVEFAEALVSKRWEDARAFLDPQLQKNLPNEGLQKQYEDMFRYGEGPALQVHFDPQFSMQQWPDKKEGDVGWVYVSLIGDGCVEAVTVVVSEHESRLKIRSIEWGRP
jgi:hypothetical protein